MMDPTISREHSDVCQAIKTALITQGACIPEYGRIVIFKKDGTEAAVFGLTGEIKIGRDRNSDIRLKIPSVSRNHARVYQDENGNCNIENLSTANITTVNGEPVQSSIILKDGDVFCVGLREFVYQNGDKKVSSDSNANLVVRHVPMLETIDESLTLDFAKHLPQKGRGKPLTPIRENINEATSPTNAASVFEIDLVKTSKKNPSTPKSTKKNTTPKSVKSPGNTLKEINAATVKQVNESIKDAINERRKSFGAPITSKSPKVLRSRTPTKKVEAFSMVAAAISVPNESLLQAVNARRRSITNASTVPAEALLLEAESETNDMELEGNDSTPAVALLSAATPIEEMTVSPIRQAINARRRSSLSLEEIVIYSDETPGTVISNFEGITIVVSPKSKKDHTKEFTTSSISRRMSISGTSFNVPVASKLSKRKSIAAPLYRSSRLSLSEDVLLDDVNTNIVAQLAIDEDLVLSCNATDRESILTFPTSSGEAVSKKEELSSTPIKSVEHRGVVIKQAICVQLAVDAFANELEMQGVPAGRAYATAIDTYLSNPSAFSPKPMKTKINAPRRRDSILVSLEAKAHSTGSSLFGVDGGDQTQLSCDLIAALTESDMDIIDAYALRLEEAGGDAGESYAIALDAFVRGVEHCHLKVKVETASVTIEVTVPATIVQTLTEESVMDTAEIMITSETSGCDLPPLIDFSTKDDDIDMGASLRALFELPIDYEGRDEADGDEKLVARYAEDLRDEACIDSAVAYGIALDTFLADPVAFRHQIGGVKARLQEQYKREPFQTPEYEYDFYYEDEAHSMAKSTIKKVNSHIFFNSPTPISTPCKMSSLSDKNDDEEDEEEDEKEEQNVNDISLINSSVKIATFDVVEEKIEMQKIEITQPSVIDEFPEVEVEVEVTSICPTTPSKVNFQAAFIVIKSAKKSPYITSVLKNKVQSPKKSTSIPMISSALISDSEFSDSIDIAVHSEPIIESVQMTSEVIECIIVDTDQSNIEIVKEDVASSVDETFSFIAAPEIILTMSVATPAKVESWLASAAASLKKSLPPQSGKKTAPNSAKKIKVPTPRQSRMGSSTPSKSALSCVNLFNDTSMIGNEVSNVIVSEAVVVEEDKKISVDDDFIKESQVETISVEEEKVISVEEEKVIEEEKEELFVAIRQEVKEIIVEEAKEIESETNTPVDVVTEEIILNKTESSLESTETISEAPLESMVEIEVEIVTNLIQEAPLETKVATPARSTRSRVAAATSAVPIQSMTPVRVTRSRPPTPAPVLQVQEIVRTALSPVVVRSTRSRATPSKKVIDVSVKVAEVAIAEISSDVTETIPNSVDIVAVTVVSEVFVTTPIGRSTSKRSCSILATLSADVMVAKRSRREEKVEAVFIPDEIIPDMIVFPSEEVPDMIVFHDIIAIETAEIVSETVNVVEEVKRRGRPSRAAKVVEVEVEEEEEALALLCDGCDAEHFLDDLGLKKIPEGDWFCNACVAKKSLPIVTSARKSSRTSVARSSTVKGTPSKLSSSLDVASTRKRGIELTNPSPAPEGRRSARLQ